MGKVAEIFAECGFKFERTTLGDFINSVRDLDMTVVASAIGVGGLYKALQEITVNAVQSATAIKLFGIETGLSAQEIQTWSNFAERVGVSSQDMLGAIKHLQEMTGPGRDVKDTLKEMNQAVQGLDPVMARLRLQGFGLASLMPLLYRGTADFNEELKKNYGISEQETDTLYQLGVSYRSLFRDIQTGFAKFASEYAPTLNEILENIHGIAENKSFQNMWGTTLETVNAILFGWKQIFELTDAIRKDWGTGSGLDMKNGGQGFAAAGFMGTFMPATQPVSNNIAITIHGAEGGPVAIGEAIAQELKKIFMNADHQSSKSKI